MRFVVLATIALLVAVAMMPATTSSVSADDDNSKKPKIIRKAATGELRAAQIPASGSRVAKTMPFISAGAVAAAQDTLGASALDQRQEGADATRSSDLPFADIGQARASLGCSNRDTNRNVRVNQDCSFRRQAEEDISFDPNNPSNLIAGQNDSRVGFNQCGIDWSTDNGKHWGDMLPPFRQRLNNPQPLNSPVAGDMNRHTIVGAEGTFHSYDAGSDPTVAFDSQGRAYFSCVAFDVASNASMVYVVQSPSGARGSFYYNIAQSGRNFLVAEDNSPTIFHDKQFITADFYKNSPNRDNVYVTWTVFRFSASTGGYQRSPIFGSMSTNGARSWSTPEEISGTSATLCFFGDFFDPTQSAHACNFDQGSDPIVLPNGDLVVTFNNGNTPADNPNGQQLAVKCHPTGSSPAGNAHLNCGAPSKVGDDVIVGEPQCDFNRGPEECIPGAFIRTNDFPRIGVNTSNGNVYVVWQDYRNQRFDIQLSSSTDGGLHWTERGTVNPDSNLDHYFPAVDVAEGSGADHVGVSYYRTERVPNENTTPAGGFAAGTHPGVQNRNSDYVLAGGRAANTPYSFKVISPVFPPPDGIQAGFNGDYSSLAINRGDEAHPIWSDTRNADPFSPNNGVVRDEDVFTDAVRLPDGHARTSVGTIGNGDKGDDKGGDD